MNRISISDTTGAFICSVELSFQLPNKSQESLLGGNDRYIWLTPRIGIVEPVYIKLGKTNKRLIKYLFDKKHSSITETNNITRINIDGRCFEIYYDEYNKVNKLKFYNGIFEHLILSNRTTTFAAIFNSNKEFVMEKNYNLFAESFSNVFADKLPPIQDVHAGQKIPIASLHCIINIGKSKYRTEIDSIEFSE